MTDCTQVDLTDNDLLILLHLGVPCEPREQDRRDAAIMHVRTVAHLRGDTPQEMERNILLDLKKGAYLRAHP